MATKPAPGETIRQVISTSVVPSAESETENKKRPEFWGFIEGLTPEQWKDRDVTLSLYRMDGAKKVYIEKIVEAPFGLDYVKRRFGGGTFKVLGKVDSQLCYNVDFDIAGPAKDPEAEPAAAAGVPAPNTEMGQLVQFMMAQQKMLIEELRASRGGDTQTKAVEQALSLSGQVFGGAAQTVAATLSNISARPEPAANPLMDKLMEIMLTRLIAPPETNAIEQTLKLVDLLKGSGLINGAQPKADLGTTLVTMAPGIVGKLVDGMNAMARMKEADLQAMAMGRHRLPPGAPANGAPPIAPAAAPRPEIVRTAPPPIPVAPHQPPAASAQQPAETTPQGEQFLAYIQDGIVRALEDPEKPADDAAQEILIFLDTAGAGQMVDQMIAAGPEEMLHLFQTMPRLQSIPADQRLAQVIRKFLDLAKESRETPAQPA